MAKPWIDQDWYAPKFEHNGGYVSVKLGDHMLVDGEMVHIEWPNLYYQTGRIVMVPRATPVWINGKLEEVNAMIPHLRIEHREAKILVPLELISGLKLRRPGGKK